MRERRPGGGREGPVDPARTPAGQHPRVRPRRQRQVDVPHRQRVTAPQQRALRQRGDKFAGEQRLGAAARVKVRSPGYAAPDQGRARRRRPRGRRVGGAPFVASVRSRLAAARSGTPVSLIAAATSVAARCGSAHIPGPCAMTTCLTRVHRTGQPQQRRLRPRQARPAGGDDHLGLVRRHELARRQQVLVPGQGVGPAPGARGRLGQYRPSRPLRQLDQRGRVVVAVSADDHAALGPRQLERLRRHGRAADPRPRPAVRAPVQRLRPAGGLAGDERVAQRQVHVHRPGERAAAPAACAQAWQASDRQ